MSTLGVLDLYQQAHLERDCRIVDTLNSLQDNLLELFMIQNSNSYWAVGKLLQPLKLFLNGSVSKVSSINGGNVYKGYGVLFEILPSHLSGTREAHANISLQNPESGLRCLQNLRKILFVVADFLR